MTETVSDADLDRIIRRVVNQTLARPSRAGSVVSIGADHRGQELKQALIESLQDSGYRVIDRSQADADYPDIAAAIARDVTGGRAWRGVVIDGAGIGSSMAANKVPGARASLCYNLATARNAREHNNANILSLGSGLTGATLALEILDVWLNTPFAGGRHARRVDKIQAIEREYTGPASNT